MTRQEIFCRDFYTCRVCSKPARYYNSAQIAHCIKQGKGSEDYIMSFIQSEFNKDVSRKWIRDNIINHPDNLKLTCSLKCNDRCNIFNNPVEREKLLKSIIKKVLNS